MTVAVLEGMETIGESLKELGYNVVFYGKYSGIIDAVIYFGDGLSSKMITASNFRGENGILMINATNKTIEQLDNFLKRRIYSDLV